MRWPTRSAEGRGSPGIPGLMAGEAGTAASPPCPRGAGAQRMPGSAADGTVAAGEVAQEGTKAVRNACRSGQPASSAARSARPADAFGGLRRLERALAGVPSTPSPAGHTGLPSGRTGTGTRRTPRAEPTRAGHAPGRAARIAAAAAAVAVAAGCSAGPVSRAGGPRVRPAAALPPLPQPTTAGRTYQVPRPLRPGRPGTLIAATDNGPDQRYGGARRWTVLYHSTDRRGGDIPVSGTVLLPPGAPPRDGRPVVSWGHGTTGVADRCAPSQAPDLGQAAYAQEVGTFLAAGYAVAASDYPGLGTPGMHSYLVGADEGNAVVDIVAAARRLVPGLAPVWFSVGHSQGGQAALFAARAAGRTPALRLAATAAIAPASHLEAMLPGVLASHQSSELTFALYSLAGLSATDPSVDFRSLLTPQAAGPAERLLRVCLKDGYPVVAGLRTDRTLAVSRAGLDRLGSRMGAYGDPDRAPLGGPVLVVQGGDDHDVPPAWTAEVVRNLRTAGSRDVVERIYPGADHDQVLARSACDVLAFFAAHGGRPVSGCAPFRA